MKKIGILILLLFCLSLTACDPTPFIFDYETLKENVVGIELINYDNQNAVEINEFFFEKSDKMRSFDYTIMEIMEKLQEDKIDNFLEKFVDVPLPMVWVHLDSPKGICLRIIYDNGDFEIFTCNSNPYAGSFDSEGNVKRFIGTAVNLLKLTNEYFETQIEDQ